MLMKKYILLAAVALPLVACNTEDDNIDEPVAAQISASIGESQSRASEVKWDNDDNIGVSMSGRYTNIKYTTPNGDGMFDGSVMYFKNKEDLVTISAYYPYTGSENLTPDAIEATTNIERQTPAEQSKFDFLYAVKENVSGAQPNINLSFSHMMSKLTFTFTNGNDGTDVRKITSCTIDGLTLEGSFNPSTGACNASASTPAASLTMTPTVAHGESLPSLILFPQTVEKVTMKITDSDNQEYGCELKFDGNRLASGNNYLFTINVKKTSMVVEKFSIAKWTEEEKTFEAESE